MLICQNETGPAKLDLAFLFLPNVLHGFSFQLRAVLK